MLDTGVLHGFHASWAVYHYLSPWFLGPDTFQSEEAPKPISGIEVMDEEKMVGLNREYVDQQEATRKLVEALTVLLPDGK
jgi:hypothetical protein